MEKTQIKYSLLPIEELEVMLGYSELKSIRNWCKENEIPIIKIGKRQYIHSWMFEISLLRILKIESNFSGMDGNEIVNAIINDDKIKLAELMNAPVDEYVKEGFKKSKNVETVEDILGKYKKKVG